MIRNFFLYLLVIIVAAITLSCLPKDIEAKSPSPQVESVTDGIGANIFAARITKAEIKKMSKLGIKFVRLSFRYNMVMREDGFTIPVPEGSLSPDEIMALLKKNNINVMITLFGNSGDTVQPITPEEISNFENYARQIASRYGKQAKYIEIWNEPDLVYSHSFWNDKPDPEKYAELANGTCKAIKEINPDIKVVGPALAHTPKTKEAIMLHLRLGKDFLQTIIDKGIFDCIDDITVHTYTKYPEDLPAMYANTRAAVGSDIPVISGELGWSTASGKVNHELQADYFIRRILIDHREHTTPSIWYQWHSNGADPKEREHGFGMTNFDKSDRPIIPRLKEFYKEMRGYSFDRSIACGDDNYIWSFKNRDKIKLAIWNGKNEQVKLSINNKELEVGSRPIFIEMDDNSFSCSQLN